MRRGAWWTPRRQLLGIALLVLTFLPILGLGAPSRAGSRRLDMLPVRVVQMVPRPTSGPATEKPHTPNEPARLAVAPPGPDYSVAAPPSISAAYIDQVLAAYHSPATGFGAVFYDLGVQYQIDPAYALAFFIQESAAGTKGIARVTRSIGNIRCTPGYRCVAGYRAYDTWGAAITEWYRLIRELYVDTWGLRTPAAILPRYAPARDQNDPAAYSAGVIALVASWQR